MRYAGMIKNDIAAAPGVCVSLFTQGCPFHCKGCHNPESWDYNGGKEFTAKTMRELLSAINANGIQRNFCIMGGEPLCPSNVDFVSNIIKKVKEAYPNIKIYIWTGYLFEDLSTRALQNDDYKFVLNNVDCIIDGQFIEELRDVTLPMRGSSNQRIIYLK